MEWSFFLRLLWLWASVRVCERLAIALALAVSSLLQRFPMHQIGKSRCRRCRCRKEPACEVACLAKRIGIRDRCRWLQRSLLADCSGCCLLTADCWLLPNGCSTLDAHRSPLASAACCLLCPFQRGNVASPFEHTNSLACRPCGRVQTADCSPTQANCRLRAANCNRARGQPKRLPSRHCH